MEVKKDLTLVKASDGTYGFFIGSTLIFAEDPCGNPSVATVAKNTSEALGLPLTRLDLNLSDVDEWGYDDMLDLANAQVEKAKTPRASRM
jgi:hypothetical protein